MSDNSQNEEGTDKESPSLIESGSLFLKLEQSSLLRRWSLYFAGALMSVGAVALYYRFPITHVGVLVAASAIFLPVAALDHIIHSRKPRTIFYLCPEEQKFFPIKSSDPARQWKACPDCGTELIKRCQQGKHYIASPNPKNPDDEPSINGFCPKCDPKTLPLSKRV